MRAPFNPRRFVGAQKGDDVGDVRRCRQAAERVSCAGLGLHSLGARDEAERGRIRYARLHDVRTDAVGSSSTAIARETASSATLAADTAAYPRQATSLPSLVIPMTRASVAKSRRARISCVQVTRLVPML